MLRWCHASLVLALLTTSICPLATVSAAPSLLSIDQGSFKVDFAGSLPQQPNPFTDTAIYSSGSNGHPDSDSDAGDGGEHDEKVHDNLAELQSNPEDSWLLGLLPDQLQVGVKFEPSVLIYELLPLTSKLNYPPTTPSGRRTPNDPSNEQFDELYTVLQQIVDELTEGLNLGNNLLPLLPYPSTELSDNTGAKDPFILELQAVQKVYQQTARWAVAMYRRSSPTIMAPIPEYSALQSVSSWLEIEKWDLDMQLQSVPKDFWELLQTSRKTLDQSSSNLARVYLDRLPASISLAKLIAMRNHAIRLMLTCNMLQNAWAELFANPRLARLSKPDMDFFMTLMSDKSNGRDFRLALMYALSSHSDESTYVDTLIASVEKVFELPKIKRMPDPGGIAVRELDDLVVDLMDFVVNEYLDTRNNLQIAIVGFNQHFPGKMPSGSSKFAFLSAEMAYHREQLLAHVLNDRVRASLPQNRRLIAEQVSATLATPKDTAKRRAISSHPDTSRGETKARVRPVDAFNSLAKPVKRMFKQAP